ncbi:MAG: ferritin, partial [Planctomycetota bacterium]|nr:ferritin [Planctomycetota bacterium]
DYATQVALQWFVTEQIEEEKLAGDIVTDLVRIGDDPTGLLLIDQKLNERANVMEESGSE